MSDFFVASDDETFPVVADSIHVPPAIVELNPEQPSEQPRARARSRNQQADDLWKFDYYDNGSLARANNSNVNITFISLTSDSSSGDSSCRSSVGSADGELGEQHEKHDRNPAPVVGGHSGTSHTLHHTDGVMKNFLTECTSTEWGFARASVYDSCEEGEEACAFDPLPYPGPYEAGEGQDQGQGQGQGQDQGQNHEGQGQGEAGGGVKEEVGGLSALLNRLVFGCVPTDDMMTHHESFLVEEGDATGGCEHQNPGGEGCTCRHSEGSVDGDGTDDEPYRARLGSHDNSLPAWDRDSLNPRTRAEQDYCGRTCADCHSSVTTAAKCCLVKSSSYYFCSEQCWAHWLTHGVSPVANAT
mmetsp:Transcript_89887/g.257024  ORF Transcript_89887/g.257024 Transcript_89887/m.257024 type:complete len:357 (+) Transcript_89887:234-1304(+)